MLFIREPPPLSFRLHRVGLCRRGKGAAEHLGQSTCSREGGLLGEPVQMGKEGAECVHAQQKRWLCCMGGVRQ